ncbi:MAG: TIR domain-containing protein [Verrucomicrobiota bacterium]|jgi:hypothetical protein
MTPDSTKHPQLEEVFKVSGIPTYTFVEPKKYPYLLSNLRTPGRCLVVEGPSGIGKTTAVEKALAAVGLSENVTKLSARRQEDLEYIEILPEMPGVGIVLVDDYHKLPVLTKSKLADYLKVLADAEDEKTKIIVLGINQAGDSLIEFAPDLVNRIDVIRFETEPDEKVSGLLERGAQTLNAKLNVFDEIVAAASGSFYLAQMLGREICLNARIFQHEDEEQNTDVSFAAVSANVWDRLSTSFRKRTEHFCQGTKLRKEGRAPYLQILNWLATGESWTLDLRDAIRRNPSHRGSVAQVVDKGFLRDLVEGDKDIRAVLHYDDFSKQLTVEDPQYLFFLRGVPWRQFARDIGFLSVTFKRRYDFALSFAGADRSVAEALFGMLAENELEVFYDKNEQHRILAEDVEEYLRPIYQSEAQFVLVLIGPEYPKRIWTKFESDAFKERFADGAVIPIWFSDASPSMFDETRKHGGLDFDRSGDRDEQIREISKTLLAKVAESR